MSSEEVLENPITSTITQEDEQQITQHEEQPETQLEEQQPATNESASELSAEPAAEPAVVEPTPQAEELPITEPVLEESAPESSKEVTKYPIINILNSINIEKSPISINDLKLNLNENISNFNSNNLNKKINSLNLNNYLNNDLIPFLLNKLSLKSSKFKYLINITSITNTDNEIENNIINLLNIQGNYWDNDTDGSIITDIKLNDNLQLKLNLTFIYI